MRIVALLGFCCVLAVTAGCGSPTPEPPPGLNEVQLEGWRAYVDLECATCHGEDREGRRSGPALTGLARNWSADQLVSYFSDPDAMITSNRSLAYRAEKFAIGMPKVSGKSPGYGDKVEVETLEVLAEYMLVDVGLK